MCIAVLKELYLSLLLPNLGDNLPELNTQISWVKVKMFLFCESKLHTSVKNV
jgi:hypothetical protein